MQLIHEPRASTLPRRRLLATTTLCLLGLSLPAGSPALAAKSKTTGSKYKRPVLYIAPSHKVLKKQLPTLQKLQSKGHPIYVVFGGNDKDQQRQVAAQISPGLEHRVIMWEALNPQIRKVSDPRGSAKNLFQKVQELAIEGKRRSTDRETQDTKKPVSGTSPSYAVLVDGYTKNDHVLHSVTRLIAEHPDAAVLALAHGKLDRGSLPPQSSVIPQDAGEFAALVNDMVAAVRPIPRTFYDINEFTLNPNGAEPLHGDSTWHIDKTVGQTLGPDRTTGSQYDRVTRETKSATAPAGNIIRRRAGVKTRPVQTTKKFGFNPTMNLLAPVKTHGDFASALMLSTLLQVTANQKTGGQQRLNLLLLPTSTEAPGLSEILAHVRTAANQRHAILKKEHLLEFAKGRTRIVEEANSEETLDRHPVNVVLGLEKTGLALPDFVKVSHSMCVTSSTATRDVVGAALGMVPLIGHKTDATKVLLADAGGPKLQACGSTLKIPTSLVEQATGETAQSLGMKPNGSTGFHLLNAKMQFKILKHLGTASSHDVWELAEYNRAFVSALYASATLRGAMMHGNSAAQLQNTSGAQQAHKILTTNRQLALNAYQKQADFTDLSKWLNSASTKAYKHAWP